MFPAVSYLIWLLGLIGVFGSPIINSPFFGTVPTLAIGYKIYEFYAGNRKRKYLKHAFWIVAIIVLSFIVLTQIQIKSAEASRGPTILSTTTTTNVTTSTRTETSTTVTATATDTSGLWRIHGLWFKPSICLDVGSYGTCSCLLFVPRRARK